MLRFQAWPAASHPQSPSSGAEQTDLPTPSGIPLTEASEEATLAAFGSSYESLVTEATRPARLFKGPRNENRTRYGTSPLAHDPQEGRAPQALFFFFFWLSQTTRSAPTNQRLIVDRLLSDPPETFITACHGDTRPHIEGGPARINRFTPARGTTSGRRTRCTRMNQARRPETEQRKDHFSAEVYA